MNRKQQKQRFRRGRKLKNEKKCVSAMAEKRETAKTAFRPRPKLKKCLKNGFPTPWKQKGRCFN
jgi:hypothetical protein